MYLFRCLILWSGVFVIAHDAWSQNLAPNPDFETFSACPFSVGTGGALSCSPWECATFGTIDYFNECSTSNSVDVPANVFGYSYAHSGVGYTGGYFYIATAENREYLTAPLLSPLVAGVSYTVSFWVSLANNACGISDIGAHLSTLPLFMIGTGTLNVTPQVHSGPAIITDTSAWTLISGCFIAEGGEQYITIGNFNPDFMTHVDPDCHNALVFSYYYIDDVTVEVNQDPSLFDFDLGDPVSACDHFEINPGLSGVFYTWEDNSNGPTLTVTQSGTYSLTITSGCQAGVDSIVVTIGGNHTVDIEDDEVSICAGESYQISLDPLLGIYTWQDDSHNADYSITADGLYQVTLDDGCTTSTDQIYVHVINPPASISLGDDINLCRGDHYQFTLDPVLGMFIWQDHSTDPELDVSLAGTYSVTISNACGSASDDVTVFVFDPPQFPSLPDTITLCRGDHYFVQLDPVLGAYEWQDGSHASSYDITSAGTYQVSLSNICASISHSFKVKAQQLPIFSFPDTTTLCLGLTQLLSAGSATGNYEWQDGSHQDTLLADHEGVYSLTITNECGPHKDSTFVHFIDTVPVFHLGPDLNICPGEFTVLHIEQEGVNYQWQDNSDDDSLLVTQPGLYWLTLSNACNSMSDTISVNNNINAPDVLNLPSLVSLCNGEHFILDAAQSFRAEYAWSTGATTSSISVSFPGMYGVTVTSACGTAEKEIVVAPGKDCFHDYFIPNIFSPNDDGVNDLFIISFGANLVPVTFSCTIYDRWGNRVYFSEDPSHAWNGTFKDQPLNTGVYVYKICLSYVFAGKTIEERVSGSITLIR